MRQPQPAPQAAGLERRCPTKAGSRLEWSTFADPQTKFNASFTRSGAVLPSSLIVEIVMNLKRIVLVTAIVAMSGCSAAGLTDNEEPVSDLHVWGARFRKYFAISAIRWRVPRQKRELRPA